MVYNQAEITGQKIPMYNSDTELLFPLRVISSLKNSRSKKWDELIDKVTGTDVSVFEQLGFVLMMVRLGGCVACDADSFRAMRGCTQCARQTIRRFKGSDEDLEKQFISSRNEIEKYYLFMKSK